MLQRLASFLRAPPASVAGPAGPAVRNGARGAVSNRQKFRQTKVAGTTLEKIAEQKLGLQRRPPRMNRRLPLRVPMTKVAEAEAKAFRKGFKFIAAATEFESIPDTNSLPEVAFVGRSNVGKSSLINALMRSTTVRVSSVPGLTRSLNFFQAGKMGTLVDMPGYGFAFAKEEDKANWQFLIRKYLEERKPLKRLFLLLDARHGIKFNDRTFLQSLEETKVKYQIVLTKSDLVSAIDLARRYTIIRQEISNFPHCVEDVMMVSSQTGAGLPKLRHVIRQVLQPTWRTLEKAEEDPEPKEKQDSKPSRESPSRQLPRQPSRQRRDTSRPKRNFDIEIDDGSSPKRPSRPYNPSPYKRRDKGPVTKSFGLSKGKSRNNTSKSPKKIWTKKTKPHAKLLNTPLKKLINTGRSSDWKGSHGPYSKKSKQSKPTKR